MANALLGYVEDTVPDGITHGYLSQLIEWQRRAEKYLLHDLGFIEGLVSHHWHGKKRDRQYQSRWKVLLDSQFDPAIDLKRDRQLVWQLTDRSAMLRDGLRRIARQRNEDSIDP